MGFVFVGLAEPLLLVGAPGDLRSPAARYASSDLSLADDPLLGDVAFFIRPVIPAPVEPTFKQAISEAVGCGLAFLFQLHVDQALGWATGGS